jgi:predicted phosphodiesterase
VTGDTHGDFQLDRLSSKKFPDGRKLTKDDFLIVCGDFGVVWRNIPDRTEQYWIDWLNQKRFTTLFVCGNHENHNRLQKLPRKEMFGGTVGIVSDSVFHLRRGEIYTIHDKKFFCFGGAFSVDRDTRTLNKTYWEEEIPSSEEMTYAVQNLNKHNNEVDFIVTHTLPNELVSMIGLNRGRIDPTRNFLSFIASTVKFEKWYCGHFHVDQDISKYSILLDRILKIV